MLFLSFSIEFVRASSRHEETWQAPRGREEAQGPQDSGGTVNFIPDGTHVGWISVSLLLKHCSSLNKFSIFFIHTGRNF